MVNTYGPNGQVIYQADPNAPGGYSMTTAYSPQQQALYDRQQEALGGLMNAITQQGAGIKGLSYGADLSKLNPGEGVVKTFDKGGQLKYNFDPGQPIQGSVGGDLSTARQQAIDSVYNQATSRLDPRFQREESQLETKLANQGLSMNSDAYKGAEDRFRDYKNDAYNQAQYSAIGAGEDAAQNMFGRQLGQGQFANQAAGQMFAQNMGQAGFNNTTAGQDFGQNMDVAGFTNAAQGQSYGQQVSLAQLGQTNAQIGNAARQAQAMAPYQQYAMLQGAQPQLPQGVGYSPTQLGQTDVMGAYALAQQQANANYQARMQAQGGLMGGLFSLGSAAIMASDVRLKTDIQPLGVRPDGLKTYTFRYKAGGGRHIGVMAHEVQNVRPDLVIKGHDGFLAVNYAALDLPLREAA